ncbi:MAG: hypothetical protein C0600_12680 [Ignavibacteria bacterium]|nr:MAG: hypothetical protein C0600_12680 [Ignavibacteria bacterium]
MAKHLVFIIGEEESTATLIQEKLQKSWGFEAQAFTSGEAALDALEAYPDVVLLDIDFVNAGGAGFIKEMKQGRPDLPVIVISDTRQIDHALALLAVGILDVLLLPIDENRLHIALRNAVNIVQIQRETARLRERLDDRVRSERLIADSREMQLIERLVGKLQKKDIPVLLSGERGAGHEPVAQAIHYVSERKHGPFVEVSTTIISPADLDVALFGREAGASQPRRIGAFEEAHNGTVYLDDIAELNPQQQEKVLHAIEKKHIRRVDGKEDIRTNVRLIAATTQNLKESAKNGSFRNDLYYILASYPIHIPPLRDRGPDIIRLAERFLELCCSEQKVKPTGFSREAIEAMYHYPWPGNVDELESAIRQSVMSAGGDLIALEHLPVATRPFKDASMELETEGKLFHDNKIVSLDRIKEQAVRRAIEISRGNLAQAARELEISRSTLYKLIEKYRISV